MKPLKTLNLYTTKLKDVREPNEDLKFSDNIADEFKNLAELINIMKNSNHLNFKKIEDQNKELEVYHMDLEKLVKKRTEELERASKKAEEASNVKTQFISNMSHELRTPLNSIILLSETLKKEIEDSKLRNQIQMINNSGNDLLYLVNDILDLTKIEAGKLKFQFKTFDLSKVIDEVCKLFEIHFKEKSIQFITDIQNNLMITSDKQRIAQVVKNLINNAYKFTDHGSVSLTLKENSKESEFKYKIIVKDTGVGINPDHFEKIFKRFEQIENGDNRNFTGSGLGLYITKIILNGLESKIDLTSVPGEGTTFTIELKDKEEEKTTSIKIFPVINENLLFNKKILLVDDDDISLFSMSSFFSSKGAIVISKESPREALIYSQENSDIDFFFLDYMMPEMTGDVLTQNIKSIQNYKDSIIFILTAANDEKINKICFDRGVTSIINKPIDWNELIQAIQSHS